MLNKLALIGYLGGGCASFVAIIIGVCTTLIALTNHVYVTEFPRGLVMMVIGVGGLFVSVICQMICEDME